MGKLNMTGRAPTPLITYVTVAAFMALLGVGAVYAIKSSADNSNVTIPREAGLPPATAPDTAKPKAADGNDLAAFVYRKPPEPLPDITFEDETGAQRQLSDWKGKVVLLNLWATWCAPCRIEMPALDRLQRELGSAKFEVIALSIDRQGVPVVKKFFDDTKVQHLKSYIDSTSKSSGKLKAAGLPTTILIDRDGREVGRMSAPAEWDSAEAKRLIAATLQ